MSSPKVSVIVPVWNVEKYVAKCLTSLLNQTLSDIEILCVDDGGTDGSMDVVHRLAANDQRLRILSTGGNVGPALARQQALDAALGEFISFVDPDDWIDVDFYERLCALADEQRLDVAKAERMYVYADGQQSADSNQPIKTDIARKWPAFISWRFAWQSGIFRTAFLRQHNIRFKPLEMGEDILFLGEVLSKLPAFGLIDNVYYYYLKRQGSITYNPSVKALQSILLSHAQSMLMANDLYLPDNAYFDYFGNRFFSFCIKYRELILTAPDQKENYLALGALVLKSCKCLDKLLAVDNPGIERARREINAYREKFDLPLAEDLLSSLYNQKGNAHD